MTRPRTDNNQGEIVQALRAAGATVAITSGVGQGFPDLVVGINNTNYLVEVKYHSAPLTEDEIEFLRKWRGHYKVVRSVEEAIRMIGR
jgi:Holliday junction resolvase